MSGLSDEDTDETFGIDEKLARSLVLAHLVSSPLPTSDHPQRIARIFSNCREACLFKSTDHSFIQIAQILVDQIVTSLPVGAPSNDPGPITKSEDAYVLEFRNQILSNICHKLFRKGKLCTLNDLAAQSKTRAKEEPATAPQQDPVLVRLESPLTSIRRAGSNMNMLPSALAFWEELGLAPVSGPKDVMTFCIPPNTKEYLAQPIERFMRSMTDAYHSCNLGSHQIFEDLAGSYKAAFHAGLEKFGSELAKVAHQDSTLVVYLVNQNLNISAPPDLCSGSLAILEGYRRGIQSRKLSNPADLVVQLVSQRFIFSSEYPVILPTRDYKRIAFELYNRCGPLEDATCSRVPYISAPAVHLAKPIPPKIEFQITTDPTSANLYNDNRVHLAYAWTPESHWLTVSWTDNVGILQWNAAYWVGEDDEQPWQPFKEVITEILGTTLDILQPQSRAWRAHVVREGRYLSGEFAGKLIRMI